MVCHPAAQGVFPYCRSEHLTSLSAHSPAMASKSFHNKIQAPNPAFLLFIFLGLHSCHTFLLPSLRATAISAPSFSSHLFLIYFSSQLWHIMLHNCLFSSLECQPPEGRVCLISIPLVLHSAWHTGGTKYTLINSFKHSASGPPSKVTCMEHVITACRGTLPQPSYTVTGNTS